MNKVKNNVRRVVSKGKRMAYFNFFSHEKIHLWRMHFEKLCMVDLKKFENVEYCDQLVS